MLSRGGVADRGARTDRRVDGGDLRPLGVRVSSERPDEQVVGVSIAASTRAPCSALALFAGPLAHYLLVGPPPSCTGLVCCLREDGFGGGRDFGSGGDGLPGDGDLDVA